MELDAAIRGRRSIRRFLEKEVPENLIRDLIEAARWAPSAKNGQQWRYSVLIMDAKNDLLTVFRSALEKIAEKRGMHAIGSALHSCDIMISAPVLIVVWNAGQNDWLTEWHSVAAAVENLLLKAHDLGLGGLWIGDVFYKPEVFNEHLNKEWKLFGAVSIGWPDEDPGPRPRMSVDEITEFL